MTTPRPAAPPLPRTEAGKRLLDRMPYWRNTAGSSVSDKVVPAILAIEAEAARSECERVRLAVEGLTGWDIEATRAYGLAPIAPRDIALLERSRIEVPPAVITVTNANRDSGLVDRAAILALLRDVP